MPVKMELSRILIREIEDVQIIELSEIDGSRSFPIVIGLPEAFAIERRLKGIEIQRPQTHDLLASVVRHLGGELKRIVIDDLKDGTFFAKLIIDQHGDEIEVDSRPSDAIALGIANDVPIFVAEHVLEQTQTDPSIGIPLEDDDEDAEFMDDEDDDDDEDELNWPG